MTPARFHSANEHLDPDHSARSSDSELNGNSGLGAVANRCRRRRAARTRKPEGGSPVARPASLGLRSRSASESSACFATAPVCSRLSAHSAGEPNAAEQNSQLDYFLPPASHSPSSSSLPALAPSASVWPQLERPALDRARSIRIKSELKISIQNANPFGPLADKSTLSAQTAPFQCERRLANTIALGKFEIILRKESDRVACIFAIVATHPNRVHASRGKLARANQIAIGAQFGNEPPEWERAQIHGSAEHGNEAPSRHDNESGVANSIRLGPRGSWAPPALETRPPIDGWALNSRLESGRSDRIGRELISLKGARR